MQYSCFLEGDGATLAVRFSESGRSVQVSDQGRDLELHYLEERGDQEVYAGDGHTLTLDPDVLLVRPNGSFRGPCKAAPQP